MLGTIGHVIAKSSICALSMFYKSGVYAMKVSCLTPGDLPNYVNLAYVSSLPGILASLLMDRGG
jgi:hypothetical protein